MSSRQEITGRMILERIHIHNKDTGGVFTRTTGSQGSGKTSVNLGFVDYTLIHHPDEKVFFSECYRAPLQIFKLNRPVIDFYVKQGLDITFRDRDNNRKTVDFPVTYFDDYDDLYDKAKPGRVSVVFFGNRLFWMDFIEWVREVGDWVHLFIDEISEVCPAYTGGEMWKRIGRFALNTLKDVRKDMINLHTNTQSAVNVDFRVHPQVMVKIFLPGAKADKTTRVTQHAIDNLKRNPVTGNHAYLDYSGMFGVTVFKDIYKPILGKHFDVICNGGSGIPYYIVDSFGDNDISRIDEMMKGNNYE